ncbi:MAG: hypothetical protein RR856_13220, partial [Acinetobacter sp.]
LAGEAAAEARRAAEEAARKNGDLEAIENSWKERYSGIEESKNTEIKSLKGTIHKLTVGRQAEALASTLAVSGSSAVLLPHIQQRITLDENNNIRILDLQGKPSAMTIEELATEFRNNPAFKPLIAANISTGGGAGGGGNGGGAAKDPKDFTEQERLQMYNTNRPLFDQLFKK